MFIRVILHSVGSFAWIKYDRSISVGRSVN